MPRNVVTAKQGRLAPWRSSITITAVRPVFATIGHIAPSANRLRARGEARGIGLGLVSVGRGPNSIEEEFLFGRPVRTHLVPSFLIYLFASAPILDSNHGGEQQRGTAAGQLVRWKSGAEAKNCNEIS